MVRIEKYKAHRQAEHVYRVRDIEVNSKRASLQAGEEVELQPAEFDVLLTPKTNLTVSRSSSFRCLGL